MAAAFAGLETNGQFGLGLGRSLQIRLPHNEAPAALPASG
jgi:hypothetical protein